MKRRYNTYNPNRRLQSCGEQDLVRLADLAGKVRYGGNPEHKMNPGDFGLMPPADPRPGKSLCDVAAVFTRHEALRLLRLGLRKGLVSDRSLGDWPKNIWSVMANGQALEAQLENRETGSYHGYPMPESDPFAQAVLTRWHAVGGPGA